MNYYRITFITLDGVRKSIVRCAHSVWHAIDIIYSKHYWDQPDRTKYKAEALGV